MTFPTKLSAALLGSLVLFGGPYVNAAPVSASSGSVADTDMSRGLRGLAADDAARRLYEHTGYRRVWTSDAEAALIARLSNRRIHGLDHVDFGPIPQPDDDRLTREIKLSRIALAYASALAQGLVDPTSLHSIYTLPRPDIDVPEALANALKEKRFAAWVDSLPPTDAEYLGLSQAYLDYQRRAVEDVRARLPADGVIRMGDTDPRIDAIAAQLIANDYVAAETFESSVSDVQALPTYTPALEAAIKQVQRDYGIADDGVIGPDTFEVLNLRPADRARSLSVALERRRWTTRTRPETRIDVNIAAARLRYVRNGELVDERKVILGSPDRETPLLQSPMFRLVANPSWTIPKSIQNTELAYVGRDYLRRRNMVLRGGWIVQRPGPGNALGQVKFDMHNRHAIYLHDTANPGLFARSERYLSHGCVRVENALEFAELIAKDQNVLASWLDARNSGQERYVDLPQNIEVRLLYRNVFIDSAGELTFRTDPYGWNEPIAVRLGFGDGPRKLRPMVDDLSP
ncbi:L,D-transpeptidase family protein [Novosphingobium sp. PS1R-30]|uniref:L,D-transpeptidase family protein n=1 Tax=Novosphingobium anseongense TaxID=3133436 RepID=A0ABU8S2F5_9SPHN